MEVCLVTLVHTGFCRMRFLAGWLLLSLANSKTGFADRGTHRLHHDPKILPDSI
jgi:hypothetical protein